MPKRSNEFQKLVYIIHQQLASDFKIVESWMLVDHVTSENREVDIVITSQDDNSPFLISIECCDRSRKASVEWVEQMWAKHHDLPTTKLLLAARAGYTKVARLKASAHSVDIIDYSEAIKTDWSRVLKLWKDSLLVTVSIQWSYLLIVTTNGQSEVVMPILGEEQLEDKTTGTIFAARQLADDLLKLHRVEEVVINQAEMDMDQGFAIDFKAPKDRYVLIQKGQATLRAVRMVAKVHKRGAQISLRHGVLGDTRFAYTSGEAFGGKYMISAIEDSAHNTQTSLHFSSSQGPEQIIQLTPSTDLARKIDDLRNQK